MGRQRSSAIERDAATARASSISRTSDNDPPGRMTAMRLNATAQVSELRQGIADELASIASPLMTRLAKVDELIAERLEDLNRAARGTPRNRARRTPLVGDDAIPLEPGRNAKPGPKPYSKGKRGLHTRVGEAKVEAALACMREQNGNAFTSKTLQHGHERLATRRRMRSCSCCASASRSGHARASRAAESSPL